MLVSSTRACGMLCRVRGQGGYTEIALGQGQTQAALDALQAAATAGGWLCIKNTHLAVTWLPELHRKLVSVAASAAPGFRLWMTSEPHDMFPPTLLRACLVRSCNLYLSTHQRLSLARQTDFDEGKVHVPCSASIFLVPVIS